MNRIDLIIKEVYCSGGIILVDMETEGFPMSALLIDAADNPGWLKKGNAISAVFKETEVSIARGLSGIISLRNKLPCSVINIKRGELMSVISLKFQHYIIDSAITTRSVGLLNLKENDEVLALIKANEITLMKNK